MTESYPSHARAVIIGGGAMGCSTLYHLAKFGIADAVLLERKRLTAGTTWHSAAQVRRLRSSNNLTQLIKYSAELYAGLEGETGQSTGWSRTGSLSIATTADRFAFIKRQAALAAAFGVETEVIGAAEAGRIWPLMRTDDIVGAVFAPDDGRVNPSDLCPARAKGASGARVLLGHALRNAMIPLVTIIALDFGALFSGALITETMFGYLGMGKAIYDAILGNDFNLALIGLLLATLTTLLANLAADLCYTWLDPRITYR